MKITRITMWAVDLPMARPYSLAGGRSRYRRLDSTIVRLDTDEGIVGWGEGCPWGSTYEAAFARGVRAGVEELAPTVLGLDPSRIDVVYRAMDRALPGHPYVKSPLDMACWDIASKAAGVPLCDMLGGRTDGRVRLHSSVPSGSVSEIMAEIDIVREQGYSFHSVKVGGDPEGDIDRMKSIDARMADGEELTFDVNRGWLPAQAVAALDATRELRRVVEQPCNDLDQHLQVRRLVHQPLAVDESLVTMRDMLRIIDTDACEVVGLKLSRIGGLTVARRMRDLCMEAGIRMNIEDTGGTGLQASAVVHLAQATPEPLRRATWLCHDRLTRNPVEGGAVTEGGWAVASDEPGIGAHPDEVALGDPVAVFALES